MKVPDHVHESIEAIAGVRGRDEQHVNVHQRGMERVSGALGRPPLLYATIVLVAAWLGVNIALPYLGLAAIDPPPFHYLHLVLTLSASLIAMVVLVTQDRQIRMTEKRSHLDLQINLLSEGKIAKVIALLEELRRDLPSVPNRHDSQARAMALPTDPQVVSEALEHSIRATLASDTRERRAGSGDGDADAESPQPPK
jgi:uncharacterized membrane protein